jgi:L-ascorbate metabolism protein UlaG (beta-lactamase superfamily)
MLPIGGTFTMDITEAARAARAINPNILIPIHYKDADMTKLKKEVGVDSGILVFPMKIGETVELK